MEHNLLRIAPVQMDIVWGNKQANFDKVKQLCLPLKGKADLIILPETFSTGFGFESKSMAEHENGECFTFVKELSHKTECAIIGSWLIEDNSNKLLNRAYIVTPENKTYYYDKRHLFRAESEYSTSGNSRLIIEFNGWFINVMICYDLRFPVWCRNVMNEYDVQIFIANWPEVRKEAWTTLLKARAIENQSYVIGVNRIGQDNTGINHTGNSVVFDYKGKSLSDYPENKEYVQIVEIHRKELLSFRNKFPAWMDADKFTIL